MPVPSSITDLSQTAGSNSPAGGDSVFPDLDNYIRAIESFIAVLRDGKGLSTELDVASSGTCDIGASNSPFARITGTTTITSFGTNYNGPRYLRFADALILTHSSTLVLPTAANITTVAGDTCVVIPGATSGTADKWVVVAYQRASGEFLTAVTRAQLQAQTYTAFTTAGTATAFTLTPTPALSALTAGQRFRVKMDQANSGTTPTLAVSGLAATAIKMYVPDGSKRDPAVGELAANLLLDIEYDGAHYVARAIPPQLATATPAVGTAAGTVGTGLLAARTDHAHPPMSGSVIQKVTKSYTTYTTATSTIPEDGTIPQNTEGTSFFDADPFTPKLASSTLLIEFQATTITAGTMVAALFVDSTANALAAGRGTPSILVHSVAAGSTSARTYKIRLGTASGVQWWANGNFGGTVGGATIVITEIAA